MRIWVENILLIFVINKIAHEVLSLTDSRRNYHQNLTEPKCHLRVCDWGLVAMKCSGAQVCFVQGQAGLDTKTHHSCLKKKKEQGVFVSVCLFLLLILVEASVLQQERSDSSFAIEFVNGGCHLLFSSLICVYWLLRYLILQ